MLTIITILVYVVVYYVSSRWFKGINDTYNQTGVDKANGWALVIFGIANVIAMCLVFSTLLYEVSGNMESFFMMVVLLGSIVFSVSITWVWKTYQERKKR